MKIVSYVMQIAMKSSKLNASNLEVYVIALILVM